MKITWIILEPQHPRRGSHYSTVTQVDTFNFADLKKKITDRCNFKIQLAGNKGYVWLCLRWKLLRSCRAGLSSRSQGSNSYPTATTQFEIVRLIAHMYRVNGVIFHECYV